MNCFKRSPCLLVLIALTWLGVFLLALFSRPVVPVDETRYLSVAWEMWQRGDFLVPYLNGEAYHHKPPLLFWLIGLAWSVFGVTEWAARLVPAAAGLVGAWLVLPMGRLLWPRDRELAVLAVWVLFTMLLWLAWTTLVMFDLLIAVCAELALLGILLSWRGRVWSGWILCGLGIALGVLAKGPVILIYVLPAALFAPLWMRDQRPASWGRWYAGVLFALLLGAGLALGWALPAAYAGGEDYRNAILWGQTANRMVESFAHQRPFWWYLPLIPLLLYPWSFWRPLWRGLRRRLGEGADSGERLAAISAGGGLLIFSFISGKQIHYLLPLFPVVALALARALTAGVNASTTDRSGFAPVLLPPLFIGLMLAIAPLTQLAGGSVPWVREVTPLGGIAVMVAVGMSWLAGRRFGQRLWPGVVSLLFILSLYGGVLSQVAEHYDVGGVAARVAQLQQADTDVAFVGKYHGEFNFTGRLSRPVASIEEDEMAAWAADHPEGVFVLRSDEPPAGSAPGVLYWQPYRSSYLVLRQSRETAPASD